MQSFSRSLALAVALAAVAACSGSSVLTGNPDTGTDARSKTDASDVTTDTPSDIGIDAPEDVAMDVAMDAPMDTPMDTPMDSGPPRCMGASDCRADPGRGVCDTATGNCVQCVASADTCPATQHCNSTTNTCESGCRSDEGCATATDGGVMSPDGAVARHGRCDTARNTCVECLGSADCAPGTLCVGNTCVVGCTAESRCPTGQTCCSGACVDTQSNIANCGVCGTRCAVPNAMSACLNGNCGVGTCSAPFADCDMTGSNGCETDTRTSVTSCGACGNACPARANAAVSCDGGRCAFACNAGFADCNGDVTDGCEVDTRTSNGNCGSCGSVCNPPNGTPACVAGRCTVARCDDGFGDCDGNATNGCETNVRTSVTHCGRCMNECPARPNGFPGCVLGACVVSCVAGFSDCNGDAADGCEVDTRTSASNCGACARMCTASGGTATCEASVCRIAGCMSGRGDCDMMVGNGCETDLTATVSNCGACGNACPARANATPTCAMGACGIACNAGFGNCDGMAANGCETDLRSTVTACGACGAACSLTNATPTCAAGACAVASCDAGFGNCDGVAANGCETNVQSTAAHCGTCGRACTYANAAGVCRGGACSMGTCDAGFSDCDYNPANGCETRGACVYASCNAISRSAPSGVYTLGAAGATWNAYCDMTNDGGGWTLVMKVPGRDGRFLYSAAIWADTSVLNDTSTDLSTTAAKFRGFSTLPFTQLRLGMVDGAPRYIVVNVSATALPSLRDVFAGPTRSTSAGRAAWLRLPASSSLQPYCNAEGFNLQVGSYQAVRLGILGNQENDCGSPDSRIGFGGQYNLCGVGGDVSCGNVSTCGGNNGDRDSALFGFIFVR